MHLLKGFKLDGPILFPVQEDLPFLAQPLSAEERKRAEEVAKQWALTELEESAPISGARFECDH